MIKTESFAQVAVQSAAELHAWLRVNHAQAESVWLVTFKKQMADRYVSTDQVLDALIAFGWIDGIRRKLDEDRTMQLIAPRKMQIWAQTYKQRATRLMGAGHMQPAGLQAIAQSKARGLWDAMADVDALEMPSDLADALAAHPPAAQNFAAFSPSSRRNMLRWIAGAKQPATRSKRIDLTATLAAKGERVPQMG
jgi:uncharacterized protein YdeI (YjbR/CyaY-like superfamily)